MSGTGDSLDYLCYNRGCGKRFTDEVNGENACTFHPGAPIFHDAYKIWSCCQKKSIDFSEFLGMKGCKTSYHSNIKPVDPAKLVKNDPVIEKKESEVKVEEKVVERPSEDAPLQKIVVNASKTLVDALAKEMEKIKVQEEAKPAQGNPLEGAICSHQGCGKEWSETLPKDDDCRYHPGNAIFHEGMKYWTCCNKKTTEFSEFLAQPGCLWSKHVWKSAEDKEKDDKKKSVQCRFDWYQTPTHVYLTVFAKLIVPEKTKIEANGVRLKINLSYDAGRQTYTSDKVLFDVMDLEASSVNANPSKIEIKLKKSVASSWPRLEFPKK